MVHGGPDVAELAALGLRADDLIDFSVNTNPLGTSPRAARAVESVDLSRYPDSQAVRLRAALATAHGILPGEVLPGNGSVELSAAGRVLRTRVGAVLSAVGPGPPDATGGASRPDGEAGDTGASPPHAAWTSTETQSTSRAFDIATSMSGPLRPGLPGPHSQ